MVVGVSTTRREEEGGRRRRGSFRTDRALAAGLRQQALLSSFVLPEDAVELKDSSVEERDLRREEKMKVEATKKNHKAPEGAERTTREDKETSCQEIHA